MDKTADTRMAFREAVEVASAVIYRVDPVGIAYQSDEYAPEADRILAGGRSAENVEGLVDVVTSVFDAMFWSGACSSVKAREIAAELWPTVRQLHGKA